MDSERIHELLERYKKGQISRREFLRLSIAAGGVVAVEALLAACAPTPAPPPAPTATPMAVAPTPTAVLKPTATPVPAIEPQLLLYTGGQDIPTIDPSDRTDYSIGAVTRALYDTLFWEEGFPPELKPMLCTDWEASEDAMEWVFHLTDKAVFHDGSPITAEAVEYSFNRTLRFQKPRSNALLPIMDENSVKAVDDYTVKMTLTAPYPPLRRVLTQPIMNPKVVMDHDKAGDEGAEWLIEHEAGSGPFVIKRWEPGTLYEMEAVPDYWGGWPGKGRLSGFIWRIIRESSGRRIALLAGEVDIADTIAVDDIPLIEEAEGYHIEEHPGYLAGYIKMNNQTEPMSDVNFRKFIAYAFDYEALVTFLGGHAPLLTGPLPDGVPFHDPDVQPVYRHDLNKAKEHLDKTPWKDGGIELDYVYVTGLEFEEQIGLILLDQLSKFNIKVNLVAKVWPDMVAMCKSPDTGPDMIMVFTNYNVITDRWFEDQWTTGVWDRPAGGSYPSCSFYKDSEFDELVAKVKVSVDEAERAKMFKDLQRMVMERLPEVPLYVMPNILGFNDRVKGFKYRGLIAVDFWPLWIEEA
ncbi:MAG: ABC transporter substrate-binding protein [Anaerolineae bacterium]